jgi:hypothetical protein
VVVVRNRTGASASGGTMSSVELRLTQTTDSALPVQELTSRGWILICSKNAFPPGSHACESGSETLRHYGTLLYESEKILRDLGLRQALLKTATTAEITGRRLTDVVDLTFEVYDPDGRSAATLEYFVATVVPPSQILGGILIAIYP